jgi:hypothetical protein
VLLRKRRPNATSAEASLVVSTYQNESGFWYSNRSISQIQPPAHLAVQVQTGNVKGNAVFLLNLPIVKA